MTFRVVIALLAALSLSACSTINFHNGEGVQPQSYTVSEWHHNAIFRLVEASNAVDMSSRCVNKEWARVTTERTFLNGLVGLIDSFLIGLDLWEPLTVEYACQP